MTMHAISMPSSEPRALAVPPDLADALEGEDTVLRAFERLPYDRQEQLVLSVDRARTPERRRQRIAGALGVLRQGWAR